MKTILCLWRNMTIRLMSINDYDAIYKFWSATPGVGINPTEDSREGIIKYLNRNPESCFVAEENNEIIGTILSGHDGRRGFIYHLAVKSPFRKQGIASELTEKVLDFLKKEGLTKVALLVMYDNDLGNDFWEKHGFTWREDLKYRDKILKSV